MPFKEEVALDAIPLAVKFPSIVDWKIHKEGKKSYYQIIRADGSSKMYLVFSHMLKSFDKEDLETLYKLVKAKYRSTRPVEDLDLVLYGDLKTMFEPHVEDNVWKNQSDYRVLDWKLYDSCGVTFHFEESKMTRHPNLPEFDKKVKNMANSQSPEVKRIILEKGKMRHILLRPSLLTVAMVVPQMMQSQKESSSKQKHGTNCEGKRKKMRPKGLNRQGGFSTKPSSEWIYVDRGSSSEVIYEHCFRKLGDETKAKLREPKTLLVGFFGEVSYPIGTINLSMTMGELGKLWTVTMEFAVVKITPLITSY
ncbi:hypothetical protein Tco_0660352 [Tanacetum coccineum]